MQEFWYRIRLELRNKSAGKFRLIHDYAHRTSRNGLGNVSLILPKIFSARQIQAFWQLGSIWLMLGVTFGQSFHKCANRRLQIACLRGKWSLWVGSVTWIFDDTTNIQKNHLHPLYVQLLSWKRIVIVHPSFTRPSFVEQTAEKAREIAGSTLQRVAMIQAKVALVLRLSFPFIKMTNHRRPIIFELQLWRTLMFDSRRKSKHD